MSLAVKRPVATASSVVLTCFLLSSMLIPLTVAETRAATVAESKIVYRINNGGPALSGTSSWQADRGQDPSPYTNALAAQSSNATTTRAIDMSHPSLPAGLPDKLLSDGRWDPLEGAEMQWNFPVAPATYRVNLYFAEVNADQNTKPGMRVFDVSVEGVRLLNDYDIFADVGAYKGVKKSFIVTSDSNIDVDFGHEARHPLINAIEIVGETPTTTDPDCSDLLDNDGDGKADYPSDPGCADANDSTESPDPGSNPACSDGLDNDGDGRTDYPSDPGCSGVRDVSESPDPAPAECSDGLDNDGDGRTDYPSDPGCSGAGDVTESPDPAPAACSDALDNDGDGRTDYPSDPGCSDAGDVTESPDPAHAACSNALHDVGYGSLDYQGDPGRADPQV